MLKVTVIGSGNVAQHLIKGFINAPQVQLVQAFARRPQALATLLPANEITNNLDQLAEADVYIISVSDDAIAGVSSLLPFSGRLVVHTSGSVGLTQLDTKNRRGVFYPLQTFSKRREVDFTTVPLCLESELEGDYAILETLAKALSKNVYAISSAQRQSLHVSAVFAGNFANHMYAIGNKLCNDNGIPFDILKPLIQETASKINTLSPVQAQTGPAVRHDRETIQKHLDLLKDEGLKAIYIQLTRSIQHYNEQEL